MTEKRYYAHKHLLKENGVHDKICHNFMNIDETVEHLNNEYWKYKQLKDENEGLKDRIDNYNTAFKKLQDLTERKINENEQLKKELGKFKEWKKHIGDVKREELDKVFKMSIYEIAEAFEYYEERIKKLEEELQE